MPYSVEEIRKINQTTSNFYLQVSDSFSATRQHEWDGWNKCLKYIKNGDRVLDLGCGNRRFSKFLKENNRDVKIDSFDNFAWDDQVTQIDIIEDLVENNLNLDTYDVVVCFGVMHHIPGEILRCRLIEELSKSKIAIVSFWQFEKDERIFNKAKDTTKIAQEKLNIENLEENDYFLCWKDNNDVFRFCHNFTNEEISLYKSKFKSIDEFNSDSGQKKLNKYLIFRSF